MVEGEKTLSELYRRFQGQWKFVTTSAEIEPLDADSTSPLITSSSSPSKNNVWIPLTLLFPRDDNGLTGFNSQIEFNLNMGTNTSLTGTVNHGKLKFPFMAPVRNAITFKIVNLTSTTFLAVETIIVLLEVTETLFEDRYGPSFIQELMETTN